MSHGHHSCHDEHNHDGGSLHDHTDDITPATHSTLYQYIDHSRIQTLNETTPHSGRAIVEKPWDSRLSATPLLRSPADDPQLLMHIPFTGQVKLHSILLRAPPTGSAPRKLKLFKNRLDLDFELASELAPTQTIELPRGVEPSQPDADGVLEIAVKRALWTAVISVTLFFVDNWGSPNDGMPTEISYLGFRGDWLRAGGVPLGLMYESAANPADHKPVHKTDWKGGIGMGPESGHGPL
ncbi:PITH domain-containing protein [Tirmania nivea]|nr:PITH domain-containing protein [Tirmania nivea]